MGSVTEQELASAEDMSGAVGLDADISEVDSLGMEEGWEYVADFSFVVCFVEFYSYLGRDFWLSRFESTDMVTVGVRD